MPSRQPIPKRNTHTNPAPKRFFRPPGARAVTQRGSSMHGLPAPQPPRTAPSLRFLPAASHRPSANQSDTNTAAVRGGGAPRPAEAGVRQGADDDNFIPAFAGTARTADAGSFTPTLTCRHHKGMYGAAPKMRGAGSSPHMRQGKRAALSSCVVQKRLLEHVINVSEPTTRRNQLQTFPSTISFSTR